MVPRSWVSPLASPLVMAFEADQLAGMKERKAVADGRRFDLLLDGRALPFAQQGLHLGMDVEDWPPENIEDLAKKFEDQF